MKRETMKDLANEIRLRVIMVAEREAAEIRRHEETSRTLAEEWESIQRDCPHAETKLVERATYETHVICQDCGRAWVQNESA